MSTQLFREEAVAARRERILGRVVLVHPVSHYVLGALACCVTAVVLGFMFGVDYSRTARVAGVLEPVDGAIKLYASQPGTLRSLGVKVGQTVHAGQVLMVFASQHEDSSGNAVEAEVGRKLREQVQELSKELDGTLQLQDADARRAGDAIQAQERTRDTLRSQVKLQEDRVKTSQDALARYTSLARSGFLPQLQLQQKQDEVIEQQMKLQDSRNALSAVEASILEQQHLLDSIPLKKRVAQTQIGRTILSTQAELSRQETAHEWSLVAPCDGNITALALGLRQTASSGVPLVTIVPQSNRLQATVYLPSRSLGFVRPGQKVVIKLDSFPYQRFGHVEGRLLSVATTPTSRSEINLSSRLAAGTAADEPVYQAVVDVPVQAMSHGTESYPLRPGMQLEADIELDTRRLWQWVLDPMMELAKD